MAISFIDNDTLNLKNAVINLGINYALIADENATNINLKDSFLNVKSLNLNEAENEISLGELDLPKFDLDSKIADKTDATINLSAINLNDIAFKSAVSASLKELNLKDISLLANLNAKSELDAKAELKNISASSLKVDEVSKNLATLKDLNASNLKANLLNEKIELSLEKTALSGINAPLSKDATTNVTNIQILGTSFTQDSNKSEASVNELNANGINLKAKKK